jgi:hypothetical protein
MQAKFAADSGHFGEVDVARAVPVVRHRGISGRWRAPDNDRQGILGTGQVMR